jgi:hypothetical protein
MRKLRTTSLDTATARAKLDVRGKPHWVVIARGISLGYRRNKHGAGTWSVRATDGHGAEWTDKIATADDFEPANEATVLDYDQAVEAARRIARQRPGDTADSGTDQPVSVGEALNRYETYLTTVGGDPCNAKRARYHIGALASKLVAMLTVRDLQDWRDGLLAKGRKPATVNRTRNCLRAALTYAARRDPRIRNQNVWQDTELFESLPDATEARNVVLADGDVVRLVDGCYQRNAKLGIFADTMSVTGSRPSQIARLLVEDLKDADTATPFLNMPRAAKGHKNKRAVKKLERVQVPITTQLAAILKAEAAGRSASARLLTRDDGQAWDGITHASNNYRRDIGTVVESLGLTSEDGEVTLYALRHSNITRMLLANVPVTTVAKLHDTSVREIERHYASKLANHSDAIARAALFRSAPAAANVIPLAS